MSRRLLSPVAFLVVAGALAPAAIAAPHRVPLRLGQTLTVTGRTGSVHGHVRRATGRVIVYGRWDDERWQVLTTTHTDMHGNYRFAVTPNRRGTWLIQITSPDKQPHRYVLRVT